MIVHEVHRRPAKPVREADPGADKQPVLTTAPITLTPELEAFFQRRLVRTMGGSYEVRFMQNPGTSVPGYVVDLLADPPGQLVQRSQDMTTALHVVQDANNPAGLVVVLHGTLQGKPFIAVMKLEHESGVRSELVPTPGGGQTFVITIENELFLTDNTRVFKAGLFLQPDGPDGDGGYDPADVRGWVSDDQAGLGGSPVARFFRETYLGCEFVTAPKLETQAMFQVTERFINGIDDPETRTRYELALISEMASQRAVVRPRNFVRDHLDAEHRQALLAALRDSGVAVREFTKDTTLIRNQIRRTAILTKRGVQVLASPGDFDDAVVTVESGDDGEPDVIIIADEIRQVRGR